MNSQGNIGNWICDYNVGPYFGYFLPPTGRWIVCQQISEDDLEVTVYKQSRLVKCLYTGFDERAAYQAAETYMLAHQFEEEVHLAALADYYPGFVAQLEERWTPNPEAESSTLSEPAKHGCPIPRQGRQLLAGTSLSYTKVYSWLSLPKMPPSASRNSLAAGSIRHSSASLRHWGGVMRPRYPIASKAPRQRRGRVTHEA